MASASRFSYRRLAYFFLSWCACWTGLQAAALEFTFQFGLLTSLTDAVVTNVAIGFAGYDMILVLRYYNPRPVILVAMSIALAYISVLAIHHITLYLVTPTVEYEAFLDASLFIRGLHVWLMIALVSSLTGLWFSMVEQQQADQRKAAMEQLAREAELSGLRQQLQPHFLFNSLNSISALVGSNPEEARNMIHQLSDFFRGTLRKDHQQLIPLSEELDHLRLYLAIEKVRFGHRLRTEIFVDDNAVTMKVPSLLLQPVVENAIKFGLYDTLGDTAINIRAHKDGKDLRIDVQNPFDPTSAPPKRGTGFGLNSIQRRLFLLYSRNDLLNTMQENNIFTTTIKIPQNL